MTCLSVCCATLAASGCGYTSLPTGTPDSARAEVLAIRIGSMPASKRACNRLPRCLKEGRHSMTTTGRPIGSKQNIQLLSALSETLERSRLNRSETLSAISALRSHVTALSSCHQFNITDALPLKQTQQSTADPSASYSELLLSKYREKCNRLQQELCDTKARLSASESHAQHLEVQWVQFACFVHSCACIFTI